MVFFNKKNKGGEDDLLVAEKPKKERKSDKAIKPSAPKSMAGKKIVRSVFWVCMGLIFLKGAIAFAQGNRTINQTIINGNNATVISDSVKGFAVDFATEYFTWDANFVADRSERLSPFVKDIEPEMGLKSYDIKGSSTVTAAEVYSTNQVDPNQIDVTVVVWRDVLPLPDQLLAAQGKAPTPEIVKNKAYMVVPVTLAAEGPVIREYPRFVSEQQTGDTIDNSSIGSSVGDGELLDKGKALADSFLHSWYDGNVSQLRYFFADTVQAPDTLLKSDFTYDKLDKVSMYENPANLGEPTTYRIEATVLVKSDLGEPFVNSWKLQVIEKEGRLYVLSNGVPITETINTPDPNESPASESTSSSANDTAELTTPE